MKKLIFFIILAGVVFKLKAQEKPNSKLFGKDTLKDNFSFKPIYPKSFINPELLIKPKQNLIANNNSVTYSEVDGMPIVKPKGNWKMPAIKPKGNYKMPITGLPPVKKDSTLFKP